MLKTPITAIVCMLIASIFGAGGQYLYKAGTDRARGGWAELLLSPWILAGVGCYIAVMVMFTSAFKAGGAVTVLYPIYASTFIWAAIMGQVINHQPIRPVHMLGMALLVVGMYLMGVGNAELS